MNQLEAVLLGVIQGLTEFLPISSSGHLVLFQRLVGLTQHDIAFDVVVHLGTLLSVITIYRKTLIDLLGECLLILKAGTRKTERSKLILWIIAGSIPTAIMGLLLKDFFESLFSNLLSVGISLWITGIFLFLTKRVNRTESAVTSYDLKQAVETLSLKKALLIGFAQGCAIAPGISRSGMTIAAALFLGVERSTAALFSFLLAIPAVSGAALLELRDVNWNQNWQSCLTGFLVSYMAGLIGLTLVIRAVKRGRLEIFSPYLLLVGALTIVLHFF